MSATTGARLAPRAWLAAATAAMLAVSMMMLAPLLPANADETDDSARWDFTGGAASDVSWHGHDGVAGAGVQFVAEGARFNGSNAGEITVAHGAGYQPEAAGDAGTWTVELNGVTPTAVGGTHRAIAGARGADDGWVVYITPQRRIEFWVAQSSGANKYVWASSGVTAVAGGTYDIVAERTGNAISIEVSGTATGTGTAQISGAYKPVQAGTPLRFGNGGNAGTEFFFAGDIAGGRIGIEQGTTPTPTPTAPEPTPTPTDPGIPDPLPLDEAVYEAAAHETLARTIGDAAGQVSFDLVIAETRIETFTVSGSDGDIDIEATTPVALSMAAGWYLKHVVHASVNLGNPQPVVPTVLPAPEEPITKNAHEASRFAFNDTNEGYTDPYLDWEGWERLLDNLALHGVNQVFLSIGTDAVFAALLQEYGYSDAEARAWIPQPAHQPWWVLQNISSAGQAPMTPEMLQERADLAKRIVERSAELGITPVLPGYFGTVPTDFADRNPGANVVPQGTWSSYQRPSWLDPTTQLFADVAADYYRISSDLIGDVGAYKMDPLHEGGRPGDVSVPGAASGIERALRAAQPDALWVLLGWQSNPTGTLLSGIQDRSKLLIVDGLSDTVTTLDRESRWPGVPWSFGSIYNFGGNTSIGAISTVWLDRYFAARAKPGSTMAGVAILPEGFYNNPAAYELMAELPWMDESPGHQQWFRDYAEGRYGTDAASDAWDIIAATAYSMEPIGTHSESHDSLFAAQPSLTTTKARACCARGIVRYDLAEFATALPALLNAEEEVVQRAAYEYDLVDVTRQVIANQSHALLPQINAAYKADDLEQFDALTARWMELLHQLDDVVGSHEDFMLGAYVERAEAQNGLTGTYDLQNLLTAWGTRSSFSLHDYANREWQGLTEFHAERWQVYFDALRAALETGGAPATFDWFTIDEDWAKVNHSFPATATNEIVVEAEETVGMLSAAATTLSLDTPVVRPGATATVTVSVQNVSPLATVDAVEVEAAVPAGLTMTPSSSTRLEGLAPSETRTVTWEVTMDPAVADVASVLTVTATATTGEEQETRTVSAQILAGSEPRSPWQLHTTEADTVFAENRDVIAIRSTGADMSRANRKFATAWQDGLMIDGETVTVRVDQQVSEGGRPWARSGIIVSNDMTSANSPIAFLAVTPENGCALSWSSTSSGSIDTHLDVPASVPVWLRMTRTGGSIEGACSADGVTWSTVGTATPAGLTVTADVGLFGSAVNSGGSDRLLGVFSEWSVGEEQPELSLTANALVRCVAGKATLMIQSTNGSDVPVAVTITTPFGSKSIASLASGATGAVAISTRLAQLPPGEGSVTAMATIAGAEVSTTIPVDYPVTSCSR